MLPKPKTNTPTTTDPQHTKQAQTQASEVLQLPGPPKLDDIPALCNKVIATILNKANRKLVDSLRKKEDQLYKKSQKRYHNNLKTAAGLQHNARDQPKLEAIRDPSTNEFTKKNPSHIINILQTHFEKEHARNTPDHIPPPHDKTSSTRTHTPNPKPTHPQPNTH